VIQDLIPLSQTIGNYDRRAVLSVLFTGLHSFLPTA